MPDDYRYSHMSPGKGESYHRQFSENSYRSVVWELEKCVLDQILQEFLPGRDIRHLDFACGTGRIIAHFEDRAGVSVGIDLSPTMLAMAQRHVKRSQLIEADITRHDVLGGRMFDLITAFRFFPNAQPELRNEALQALDRHLAEDGCLVFNNHRNLSSLRNRLARVCRRGGHEGMAMTEVEKLVLSGGLQIVRTYHLCVLPASEERPLLPQRVLRPIESMLSCCPLLRSLGDNLIYVCKHAKG